MFSHLPSLPALQTFEAAARLGSFTAAARELHVTQGAVSHQIRNLEDDLGFLLFTRLPRRVELTLEGRALGDAVTRGLTQIADALRRLEERRGRRWLSVSVSHSFAVRWLVPRLDEFGQRYPEADVRISSSNRMIDPRHEDIDLCIRFGEGGYPDFDSELLITEEVFPVCSPRLLEDRPLREPADLRHHTLLHDDVLLDRAQRPSWERWLALAGVRLPDQAGPHFSHTTMTMTAAVAGQGVALGRTCLVVDDLRSGRLVRPFALSLVCPFSYWLVAPRGGLDRKSVADFVAWLRANMPATATTTSPPSLGERHRATAER